MASLSKRPREDDDCSSSSNGTNGIHNNHHLAMDSTASKSPRVVNGSGTPPTKRLAVFPSSSLSSSASSSSTAAASSNFTPPTSQSVFVNPLKKPASETLSTSHGPDYLKMILMANVYDVAVQSPLQKAHGLSTRLKNTILLKREDLQPVFSFKLRGAYNRMQQLSEEERKAGVIACSAGNHAQGVALAAQRMGIRATIVMPLATPSIKWRNVERLGATVVLHGNDFDEAKAECARLTVERKLTNIPPYDDPHVIAGQGTIGVEILRQLPPPEKDECPRAADAPVDAIFVCVGGGGLIAGIASYVKRVCPGVKIIGVETFDADAMTRSLNAGERVTLAEVGLFADGAAVRNVGVENFRIVKDLIDEMVLVSTDEICAAIKDTFEETRSVIEPAGALGVAGCKKYIQEKGITGGRFVAICSGANMDFTRLRFVADRADLGLEKEALITVRVPERPGSFLALYRSIYPRAVTEFSYRYGDENEATIFMGFQVTDRANEVREVLGALEQKGMSAKDASENEMAKAHAKFLVGGRKKVPHERLFRFAFPERPGALNHFLSNLDKLNEKSINISLWHYRNYGGDVGKVMVGFQVTPEATTAFQSFLETLKYPYVEETENPLVNDFF